MKYLIILALSVLSAIAYRMGGSGNYNRLWRIMGVSALTIVAVIALLGFKIAYIWVYVLTFGLLCGSISTYWDFLFGFDNFWFHGFMLGVACFLLYFLGVHWYAILIRSLVLAIFMGVWCLVFSKDITEECGRGAVLVATIPLLLI